MGTNVIGNLDSQVWKMLGIDVEDAKDKNIDKNNENEDKSNENKRDIEEERLRRD